jgi:hypothetical protein
LPVRSTFPRGLGRGEGYGDTVVTLLERADNSMFNEVAEIFGLPAASLTRNTLSDMSLFIRFKSKGVGDLAALADAEHV